MKRILILGGNYFQKTAIIRAKELGYYVITADYLPSNPGHKYADEYHNVSTIDKKAILGLAEKLAIDGILSYASDISAPTAAFVSERLNLPTNPLVAVETLTNKGRFRAFLREQGMATIKGEVFSQTGVAKEFAICCGFPVMVKPVDSSGSKGVTKVIGEREFDQAFATAMAYSTSKRVIVEEYIKKKGYQIDGDGFIRDSVITTFIVMDQHNDIARNPHAPIGLSYPSIQPIQYQVMAYQVIQKIFETLGMKFGAFNFEYIVGDDDKMHLLEIGPRNGGNFIPDTIKHCTGIDMISASIKACLGDDYTADLMQKRNGIATSYVVHSTDDGIFSGLTVDLDMATRIRKQEIFVNKGDQVNAFKNGRDALGCMVLEFESIQEMNRSVDHMWDFITVEVN